MEDISTLVLRVTSDGISDGAKQLDALTKSAAAAEGAAKKLATEIVAGGEASSKVSGVTKAMADATDKVTTATGKLTLEQRKQVYEFNESAKAYKAAAAEAYKINAAIDANTVANASSSKAAQAASAATAAAQKRADAAMVSSQAATDALTRSMGLLQIEANKMNATVDAAPAKQRALAVAMAEGTAEVKKNTGGHGSNAAAMRESMVLIHELSQGSYKRFAGSLMVLANQMDVIPKLMALINAESKLMQFGVLGIIGVVGLLAYAMYSGGAELHKFNNELILTGNRAGVTVQGIEDLSKAMQGYNNNGLANTRNTMMALAESGLVAGSNLAVATEAMTDYARLSGKSAKEVVKEFEGMRNGVEAFAMEHNKTTGALSANTLQTIHEMELMGDTVGAQNVYWLALDGHLNQTGEKLTKLGQSMRDFGNWFKEGWHDISHLLVEDTFGEQLAKAQASLEKARARAASDFIGTAFWEAKIKSATADILRLKPLAAADTAAAKATSAQTNANIEGGEALKTLLATHKRLKDKAEKLDDVLLKIDVVVNKARAGADGASITDAMVKEIKDDAREKYAKEHKPRGTDDAAILRNTELVDIKSNHKQITEEYEEFVATSKTIANKEGGDRQAQLAAREYAYQAERLNITLRYSEQLDELNKFHGKTQAAISANKEKVAILRAEYNQSLKEVDKSQTKDEHSVAGQVYEDQVKLTKEILATGEAAVKAGDKAIQVEIDKVAAIGQLKSVAADFRAQESFDNAARLQEEFDIKQAKLSADQDAGVSPEKTAAQAAELMFMAERIQQQKTLGALKLLEAHNDRTKEAEERNTKGLDSQLAAAKRFEKGMTDAFGNVGKAIGGVAVAIGQMAKDMDTAQLTFNHASVEDKENGKAQIALTEAKSDATLNGYANMAGAAAGFFDKQSKGYKIMEGVSQAFHLAQLARNVASTISGLAAGAAQMFATMGPAGFAGVAAMVAVVAALGFSGGGSGPGTTAAQQQKTQGTGGVFGDADAKSETVTKSIELLEKNSNMMLPLTQAMTASLKNIESAMTGLTNLVLRTTGLTNGTNMGITEGKGNASGIAGVLQSWESSVPLIGGLLGKIASLWGGTTTKITDSGIQLGGKVTDLQAGKGYDQYASVDTTKSSFFGLSKSTSNSVQTQGLSAELSSQFGLIFTNLEDTLKVAATALGSSSSDVGKAIENMVLETTKVSLNGLKGKDLQDALNGVISKTMDQIAEAAFPQMGEFRQVGEGYAQTVIRVASSVEQAQVALKEFGIQAIYFGDVAQRTGDITAEIIQQSIGLKEGSSGVGAIMAAMTGAATDLITAYRGLVAARKSMSDMHLGTGLNIDTVTAAGGLDKLTSSLSTYYDKYFTTAEKAAIETANVTASFNAIGKALPESRDQLRSWIEQAASIGDQSQLAKLLGLAEAFDKVAEKAATSYSALDISNKQHELEIALMTAQGNTEGVLAAQRKDELDALALMSPALVALQKEIYKVTDAANAFKAAMSVVDTAFSSLSASVEAQKTLLNKQFDDAKTALTLTQKAQTDAASDYHTAVKKGIDDKLKIDSDAQTAADSAYKAWAVGQLNAMKANIALQSKANDLMLDMAKTHVKDIQDILDSIQTTQAAIAPYDMATAHANALATVNGAAGSSDVAGYAGIKDAISELAKPTEELFSSQLDYQRSQAEASNALSALTVTGASQMTDAQKQVELLTALKESLDAQSAQLSAVISATSASNTDALKATAQAAKDAEDLRYSAEQDAATLRYAAEQAQLQASHDTELAALDAILASAQRQIDALTGIDTSVKSMTVALGTFAGAVSAAAAARGAATAAGVVLPSFAVGTNDVPEDMFARIHKGERIIPAADNAELKRQLKDNSDDGAGAEMADLKGKLDDLTIAMKIGDVATIQKINDLYRIYRDWDANGLPPTRPTTP